MDVYVIVILFLLVACLGLAYETRKRGEDLDRDRQAHEADVNRLRRDVEGARQVHQKEVAQLRNQQQREMEQVRATHRAELDRLRESQRQGLARHESSIVESSHRRLIPSPRPLTGDNRSAWAQNRDGAVQHQRHS